LSDAFDEVNQREKQHQMACCGVVRRRRIGVHRRGLFVFAIVGRLV